ncbi:MAG TPA: preprotein translocase subunit SecA, partial [Solirubrobacterales bacterium]
DYLRDNMVISPDQRVQRGHWYAIVDEVDSVLIDEARTPLIISGPAEESSGKYRVADGVARQLVRDTHYEVKEKERQVSLLEVGIEAAERLAGIESFYTPGNEEWPHFIENALRAKELYARDDQYVVEEGEVVIVDEFTGRKMHGRRWSDGLHQAVETKEGLNPRQENQTLATITFQNYFRLFKKLAGMTGTALTEATEFMKIYKVPVVEVPTHSQMVRADQNDQIFKTKDGKWGAVIEEIVSRREAGQPVLVGTVSVEVSEMISDALKRQGIQHAVLNAKPEHAEREGELIAQAGRKGAVMIATNMAGRGVDIKLGGDPEQSAIHELKKKGITPGSEGYEEALAEKTAELEPLCKAEGEEVRELGGLFICGTERHESRRIDNQLRGRAGRQGDPGESRFFLSAEDDVIRLFAGDRIYNILDKLGPTDEEGGEVPLEAKMLTKTVENAQKKVEEQNFLIRKRVLEYDDVMNEQRRVIYKYRREILEGRDMSEIARDETEGVIERLVDEYTSGELLEEWDLEELETQLRLIWPVGIEVASLAPETVDKDQLKDALDDDAMSAYDEREEQLGEELMRFMERSILLQVIDNRWREHLFDMDYLREGIHLRGFAQIDPLVAYKNEGYSMFEELMHSIWDEFSKLVYRAEIEVQPDQAAAAGNGGEPAALAYSGGTAENQPSALQEVVAAAGTTATAGTGAAAAAAPGNGEVVETVVKDEKENIGRNDPCWCGSGKKFKKCHGA